MASNVYSSSQPARKRRKRVKMLARITSYDYNIHYDLAHKSKCRQARGNAEGLYSAPIHEESYDVMPGEILMSVDQSRHYRDGQIHCFSFANCLGSDLPTDIQSALVGADQKKKEAARVLAKFMIMDRLTYVGIAVTGFDSKRNKYQDVSQGFVGTFAGLNTIINTSRSEIRPGDWITVGLPSSFKFDGDAFNRYKKQEGIPLDKLLFSTDVYKPSSSSKKVEEVIDAFTSLGVTLPASQLPRELEAIQGSANLTAVLAKGAQGLEAAMGIDAQARRLIIGKALSYGRPGEPFDIVLGSHPGI